MFWGQDDVQRYGHLLFPHRKDVFPREKILNPDVPVAVVSFPHLLERGPEIDRLHPADGGRIDILALARVNGWNIHRCFVVIVQRYIAVTHDEEFVALNAGKKSKKHGDLFSASASRRERILISAEQRSYT